MEQLAEKERLRLCKEGRPWKKWGPYLSERQWGTVREDYGLDGESWDHITHDQARSYAYRWGEDGLAGSQGDFSQVSQQFALGGRQVMCHGQSWLQRKRSRGSRSLAAASAG